MKTKSINDYINSKYLEYSKYVATDRAIPSIIDGFKPVQRKVFFTAQSLENKFYKVFQVGGIASFKTKYSHGDSSINDAIISMSQPFKNNLVLFDREGQFGSLRNQKSGDARYIYIKNSNQIQSKIFKDSDLLEYKYEEGSKIEPNCYYPIIPTILCQNSSGMAVGFKNDVISRCPISLCNSMIHYLETDSFKKVKVKIDGYRGKVNSDNSTHVFHSKYEIKNSTTIHITELPPQYSFEKYESILDDLIDKNVIKSYENNSANKVDIIIKVSRSTLQHMIDNDSIINDLKLYVKYSEVYTFIDENNKVIIFSDFFEILKYFINFRLSIYEQRKTIISQRLTDKIDKLESMLKFINLVVSNKVVIANVDEASINKQLTEYDFLLINNSFDYLLNIPLKNISKNNISNISKSISDLRLELSKLQEKSINELYVGELKELKKFLIK